MHILIVEEEDQLRHALILDLKGLGHTVVAACDGREALEMFHDHKDSALDFAMIDYDMPHLTGPEVTAAILQIHPELPICIMTGLMSGHRETKARVAGALRLAMKPFTVDGLKDILAMKKSS